MASRTQFISERSVVEASYVTTIELLVLTFESRTSPASQSHMVKGDHCPHVSQQCCLLQIEQEYFYPYADICVITVPSYD